jgi:uncharacterized membrane protein (DUF2068 family)
MLNWINSYGMRAIAVFEAVKGALVLLAGFGVLKLLHRDMHAVAIKLIEHLHLDPTKRLPHLFINAASHVTDLQLWLLVLLAIVYAAARFIEAYGLWRGRRWAEWFALISGAIYLPFEIYELARGVEVIKVGALAINILVIIYMALMLRYREQQHQSSIGHSVPADIPPST